jgi:chromosome segregation protein
MDRDYQATLTRFLESRDALKSLNDFTQSIQEQINNGREQRAHFNALFQAVNEDMAKTEITLSERFDQSPTQIHHHVTTHLPDYALNIVDLERYKKERDSTHQKREQIGGVNLRAEEECIEIEQELGLILSEHEDLTKAVEELRSAIDKLNKEAKSRIQTAFTLINGYFSNIFVRLFGGGQAYLKLIEFDSDTDSGLEIYAQPPGKSLQSLSLLSGGEQTMTAIALIFAMFMANPSPICVLDEVDAPLDDANVDRFCDLLDEFAAKGLTRFLVITHHRLTMARMDCLYGVTMREKGVSQLISMDIQQQLAFMDEVAA